MTGGGLDHYNVKALFVNIDNMWTERFENYDCLVSLEIVNLGQCCCFGLSPLWFSDGSGRLEYSDYNTFLCNLEELT